MKHFASFCSAYNVCDPFPVSELTLCYYSSYLAKKGLAPQTIKSYLAALRNSQISMGLPDPRDQSSLPLLKRVQAGISRIRLQSGKTGARVRLPITTHIMAGLRNAWQGSTHEDKDLLWAVACTAFFGFFRLGELLPSSTSTWMAETDLAWGDVAVDSLTSPSMVQVHLKKSKTDPYGQGADVVMGVTNTAICPVKAMCQFLQVRGAAAGPFFVLKNGSALTKPAFIEMVRTALQAMGLPPHQYAGHSFRIGAATTAALAGLEDSLIQTLGRWHSTAFLSYVRTPKSRLARASASLVQQPGR